MARPIDEKIVRMTLDNARFKQDVQATLRSFDDINKATKNAGSMDLSNMAKGISNIERRFSASGVIVASVLKNLTDKALTMGKGAYHAMVDPIVEGGKTRALNIEQAKFQFEGLGMDVDKTMASALEAVKGTAYGLDEAAIVAGQFGASGMKAGDEMTTSLRGIAGVAAMTGSSYSDVGNIFTKVAGNGRLMGDDLLRLGARGVNAAAVLAKEFGVTESAVREMVTAGEVSFEMFSTAMANAFGEHATRANETYTGSLANMRAALGRIGAVIQANKFEQLRRVINAVTPVIDDAAEAILPLSLAINDLVAQIADSLIVTINKIDFSKFIELGGMENIVQSFWNVVAGGKRILEAVREGFLRMFPNITIKNLVKLTEGFMNLTGKLTMGNKTYEKVVTIFQGIFSVFSTVWEIAKVLGRALLEMLPDSFGDSALDVAEKVAEMAISFNESVKEGNWLTDTIEALGRGLGFLSDILSDVIGWLVDFAKNLRENVGKAVDWLGEKLAPVWEWIKEAFGGIGMDDLLKGGLVVTIGLVAFKIGGFVDKIMNAVDRMSGRIAKPFTELGNAIKTFQKNVKYKSLLLIAGSVLALAISLKILEGISIKDLTKGLTAIGVALGELAGMMYLLGKMDSTPGFRAAAVVIALAIAVGIMAIALKKISDLNPDEMQTGLKGLLGITLILTGAVIAISKLGGKIKTSSIGLIALATSVLILSVAVKMLSKIDAGDLKKSVIALGVIFLELALFIKIVNKSKINVGTGIAMIGIAASILLIVQAIKMISNIDAESLEKGLIVIAIILAEIGVFANLTKGWNLIGVGIGLTAVAAALLLMTVPLKIMANMEWEELARGLTGMGVALAIVVVAGKSATGIIPGAVGITIMAVALNLLLIPVKQFANMTLGEMAKGFGGLAVGMALMGAAGMLLIPAVPGMLGFGAAVALLGVAVGLAGIGVAAFGWGLMTLATMTATSVGAIIDTLGLLIKGLLGLIPIAVEFIVDLTIALVDGLMKIAPKIVDAIIELTLLMFNAFNDNVSQFIEIGAEILIKMMDGLAEYAPQLIDSAYNLIIDLINGMSDAIEENGPQMIQAIKRLLGEILLMMIMAGAEVIKTLFGFIPGVNEAMDAVVGQAETVVREAFNPDEEFDRKMSKVPGAITGHTEPVSVAMTVVGTAGMDAFEKVDYYTGAGAVVDTLTEGLSSKKERIEDSFGNMGVLGRTAFLNEKWEPTGGKSVKEVSDGANEKKDMLGNTMKDISTGARKDMASIPYVQTGVSSLTGFDTGAESTKGTIERTTKGIAEGSKSSMGSVHFDPTGRLAGEGYGEGVGNTAGYAHIKGKLVADSTDSGIGSVSLDPTARVQTMGYAVTIGEGAGPANRNATMVAGSANTGMGSYNGRMNGVGSAFSGGFVRGIGSMIRTAANKARELASSAWSAAKGFLRSKSPSRLMMTVGDDFGEGFVLGIGDKISKAATVGKTLAKSAAESVMGVMPEADNEIRFKIIVDDDDVDWAKFNPEPMNISPNAMLSNNLVGSLNFGSRQNEHNDDRPTGDQVENNEYNYEVNVTANGTMSRPEVRKLAEQIQSELKNSDDRRKMSRGEAVIF